MKTFYDKDGNVLGTFLEQGDAAGSGGGSSINVIDFNGIILDDFNEGFYNNVMSLYNENNPTFVKNVGEITPTSLTGLTPVMVKNVDTVYEEVDHEAITIYFMYDSATFDIQVLDNDYVRVYTYTLVEELEE